MYLITLMYILLSTCQNTTQSCQWYFNSLSLLLFQLLPSEKFVNTLYQNISSITLLVLFFVFNALVLCIFNIVLFTYIWMNTCIAYCMFCFTYEMYSYVLFHILHVLPCTTTVQARSCIWARFPTHIFPTVILFHVWMSQWTKGMNSNFWNPNFMAQFECLVLSLSARADISLI